MMPTPIALMSTTLCRDALIGQTFLSAVLKEKVWLSNTLVSDVSHGGPLDRSFEPFGNQHLLAILLTLVLACALPLCANRCLSERGKVRLGVGMGLIVAGSYFVWVFLEMRQGTFQVSKHLPLHLCWIANLALPVVMTRRYPNAFDIVYFWGLVAGLQATLTPTVKEAFPHFEFFRYILGHNGMVIVLVYGIFAYDIRPAAKNILWAFAAGNLVLLLALLVNLVCGSNYFFLCEKPRSPTLIDAFGPWPWYVLVGEVVALLHFAAAYLPFWLWDQLFPQKTEQDCSPR